jgi:hypothetical protein
MFDIVSTVFLNSLRFHHRFDDREQQIYNERRKKTYKRNQFVAVSNKTTERKTYFMLKTANSRSRRYVCLYK